MRRLLALALVVAPAVAAAQTPPAAGAGTAAPPAGQAGPGQGQGQADQPAAPAATGSGGAAAPAGSAKAGTGQLGGYAYSDKPAAAAPRPARIVRHVKGPVATLPGFEETTDGGSRLFVQLTQNVPVEERKAQGSITYVLKGAHVTKRNNTNALVTVHFNTPVWRARLVPQGNDLLFVVDLRAAATPSYKMTEAQDHTAMLTVDFPKGDYTNVAVPQAPSEEAAPHRKGGKKKKGSAPAPDQGAEPAPSGDDSGGGGNGPTP